MVSRIQGERLIVVGTLDTVETGQEFVRLPPHMTLAIWFQLQENRIPRLTGAMDRIFTDQDFYQNLVGGKAKKFGEAGEFLVREVLGAEAGPSFALRAFIRSLGAFRSDDVYADRFTAHVTDDPTRRIAKREKFAIPTVALVSAHSERPLQHVIESFKLGEKDNG